MRETIPSATALRAAIRRAAHQVWDEPRVFEDPLSLGILGAEREQRLRNGKPRWESSLAGTVRAIMVVRSRFCEESLADAVTAGVGQYVILGAGLDTFAFRNPYAALRVFEVDHPASQAWKQQLLGQAGIVIPPTVDFVPFDLIHSSLEHRLQDAGWEGARPTFFSCLGVSAYLTREAFFKTLRLVAGLPSGSAIVFDVATPSAQVSLLERVQRAVVQAKAVIGGEPLLSRFDPDAVAAELRTMGFRKVEVFAAGTLNQRYLRDRRDGLRVADRSALIRAIV